MAITKIEWTERTWNKCQIGGEGDTTRSISINENKKTNLTYLIK